MMIRRTRRIQQWTMVDLTTDLSFLFGDLAQVGFLNRERVFLFHIGSCTGWCSKHFFILVPKLELFIVPKSFCANGSPLYPRLFPTVLCRCALSSPLPGIPRWLGCGRLHRAQVPKNEGHQQPIQPSLDLKRTLQLDLQ